MGEEPGIGAPGAREDADAEFEAGLVAPFRGGGSGGARGHRRQRTGAGAGAGGRSDPRRPDLVAHRPVRADRPHPPDRQRIFVERINAKGGLLGRPVQYVLLDDQSKPDVARTLYERLITADKVDLILGPYGTAAILAAMGVAQRYHKVFIQNTMGVPALATYEWHFSALVAGAEPNMTAAGMLIDRLCQHRPSAEDHRLVASKFPSAQYMAKGMRDEVAQGAGIKVVAYLEYDIGTRDFGADRRARQGRRSRSHVDGLSRRRRQSCCSRR